MVVEARGLTQLQARPRSSMVASQGSELAGAATSCARWIRAAAGGDSSTVRVAVLDHSGRLRVIASEGRQESSAATSRRRLAVFRTLSAVRMELQRPPGLALGIFPLVGDGGDALGVVEITAPTAIMRDRQRVLVALVEQSALVLNGAGVRGKEERTLAGMSATLKLASDLLWARTSTEAVRLTVGVCAQHLGVTVTGLLPDRDGWGWFLAASDGLGVRRRDELRTALRGGNSQPGARRPRLSALRLQFRNVTRCREVMAARAGAAVLLLADVRPGDEAFIQRAGALLEGVLRRIGRVRPSADRVSELTIAWTAHELRGPLVGARAALDQVSETMEPFEGQELLRRTREELRQLSDLVDPLLRWSTGGQTLDLIRADLVEIIREAIASAGLELGVDRIVFEGPKELFVDVEPGQIRSAVANVVRNALMYSPSGSPVAVRIEPLSRAVQVVVQDRGPGIPITERDHVFDPFSRGDGGRSARRGSGLGLFIARRVLEAHGGTISLRSSGSGATFVLEIPFSDERREPSAS